MRVKILIEFEVEPAPDVDPEDAEGFDESTAKGGASMAAYNYLTFCENSGFNTDTEAVTVHVDGFGECVVKLGENHE
jgi:hypothetical protein